MARNTQRFNPRQSMHRPDYEVFHYQDPKMQEVPLHHHDFYEIYYFLSGSVEYLVEGRSYTLRPNDILLISPMELHRPMVAPDKPYERIVLWIDADYLDRLPEGAEIKRCFGSGHNLFPCGGTAIPSLARHLVREDQSGRSGSRMYAEGIFLQLMAEVMRLAEEQPADAGLEGETPLVSQVLRYIGEHFREELRLDSLAARFYVSKYYLAHEFRESVGTSVYHYILLKRLQHARQMLAEGHSPGDACQTCGFPDYANFYRSFRRIYGISPQEAVERPQA